MLRYFHKNAKGFTLIELLIVVAIIGILAAIAIPNLLNAQRRAKISRAAADTKTIVTQTQLFYNDKNLYPSGLVTGSTATGLRDAGYISAAVDPFSTAAPAANYLYTLNGAAFAGQINANMTDAILAWSVGPDTNTGTADDVGYSTQGGAFGS
jgi:prepilin-type N-terminal cleavage/methylation domain-containing protein